MILRLRRLAGTSVPQDSKNLRYCSRRRFLSQLPLEQQIAACKVMKWRTFSTNAVCFHWCSCYSPQHVLKCLHASPVLLPNLPSDRHVSYEFFITGADSRRRHCGGRIHFFPDLGWHSESVCDHAHRNDGLWSRSCQLICWRGAYVTISAPAFPGAFLSA